MNKFDEYPYEWKQSLADVTVNIPVPSGTSSRDLDIKMTKTHLKVGLKNQEPLINGELQRSIKLEDSTWSIEDKKLIVLHLEKINKMEWWASVIKGHPEIDTTKCVPENSKLDDLDGDTRQMVEKMMFDQRQKAAGKPTIEEAKKYEMLEKFKQQHPEMDFSNVKME